MMLNWDLIDNEKTFQKLANDVFALELGKPGFLSSSPYIGKDGAWDGRFQIPFQGVTGLSMVQAKWTKYSLDNAMTALKKELADTLTSAKELGVENLYFVTNADLRVGPDDHIGILEAMNQGHVKNLFIYSRDIMRPLIEKSLIIRHIYFGIPQRPLFVPFTDYFSESEPDIVLGSTMKERSAEIAEIDTFLAEDQKKVLVVHAPQGEGKSRFLFQIAENIQGRDVPEWNCLFCRPSLRSVEDAMQDEIEPGKKYVIVLDNADMYEDVSNKLLDIAKITPGNKFKIIFSTRTSGKDSVDSFIRKKRITEISDVLLGKLSEESLIDLLKSVSPGRAFEHPERIIRSVGSNPFFVISYGKLISGDAKLPELKEKIRNALETSSSCLASLNFLEKDIKDLLVQIALVLPFKIVQKEIIENIATSINKDVGITIQAIEKLIEVGVLRHVGASIRFSSDLNGNVYLGMSFDDKNGKIILSEAYKRWLPIISKTLTANIATATVNSESTAASDISGEIIRDTAGTIANHSDYEINAVLDWVKNLTYVSPQDAMDLLTVVLEKHTDDGAVTRDSYGPVIQGLIGIPGFQERTLEIIRIIAEKKIRGTYSNYEPATLVRSACSPISTRSIDVCIASIFILEKWLEGDLSLESYNLILAGIKEALNGSHEHRESYGITLTVGRRSLQLSPKIEEYRNAALEVYKKAFKVKEPAFLINAVKAFSEIGDDMSDNMFQRVQADRLEVLNWFDEMIDNKQLPYPVLAKMDDILMLAWSNNQVFPDISVKAEELLAKIERPAEFQMYKLMTGSDFAITDFQLIKKDDPVTERWSWLVHNHMHRFQIKEDDISELITPLKEKYKTAQEIIDYLSVLDKDIQDRNWTGYIPLVLKWGHINPEAFLEIFQDKDMHSMIPPRFMDDFMRIAAKNIVNYIPDFAESLITKDHIDPLEIDRYVDLCRHNKVPPEVFVPAVEKMLPKLDEKGLNVIINRSYFLFDGFLPASKSDLLRLVNKIYEQNISEVHLDASDFLIPNLLKEKLVDKDELSKIKEKILDVIKNQKRIDYTETSLLDNLTDGGVDELLGVVDYRLRKRESDTSVYLSAIPYNGFKSMYDSIKTHEDFSKLMTKIIAWKKEDLISSYDVDHLLLHIKDKESLLINFIQERLATNNQESVEEAIVASYGLDFGASTADAYLKVLEVAEGKGLFEEAKSFIAYQVVTGEYSGTIGQVPPAMASKKETLELMLTKAKPGVIKNLVSSLLQETNRTIEGHLSEAAEYLDPKN